MRGARSTSTVLDPGPGPRSSSTAPAGRSRRRRPRRRTEPIEGGEGRRPASRRHVATGRLARPLQVVHLSLAARAAERATRPLYTTPPAADVGPQIRGRLPPAHIPTTSMPRARSRSAQSAGSSPSSNKPTDRGSSSGARYHPGHTGPRHAAQTSATARTTLPDLVGPATREVVGAKARPATARRRLGVGHRCPCVCHDVGSHRPRPRPGGDVAEARRAPPCVNPADVFALANVSHGQPQRRSPAARTRLARADAHEPALHPGGVGRT